MQGRNLGQMIVAIRCPPNAGLVIFRLTSSMLNFVLERSSVEEVSEEVYILVHVDVEVSTVCSQTSVQSCCTSRTQVTTDIGSSQQDYFRF